MNAQDLKLSIMLKLVDKITGPASMIERVMKKVNDGAGKTQSTLRDLAEQGSKINYLQQMQKKLGGLTTKLNDTQREAAYFRDQMEKTYGTKHFKTFQNEMERSQKHARKLLTEKNSLTTSINKTSKALKQAGIDTRKLGKAQQDLSNKTSRLNNRLKIQKRLHNGLNRIPAAMAKHWGKVKTMAKWSKIIGSGVVNGFMSMINKAADFEEKEIKLKGLGDSTAKAKSWNGMVSNLSKKWSKFQLIIMNSGPFDKLKGYLGGLLDKLNVMEKDGSLKMLAETIGKNLVKAIDHAVAFGKKLYNIGIMVHQAVTPMASFVGGWDNLAIALAALKFTPVIDMVSSLGMGVFNLLGGASGLGNGLLWIGKKALPTLGKALLWAGASVLKFSLALLANPITWIIAGVAALAAVAYLIYKNWEPISNFFSNMWTRIKSIFANWTPLGLFIQHWDAIVAWATPYWQKLSNIFSMAWEGIKSFFFNWTPLGLFIQHWDAIVAWATPYWQKLSTIFSTAWEGIKSFFSNWNPITLFTQIWDNVTTYFSGLPSRLADAGRNIIAGLGLGIDEKMQWIKDKVKGLGSLLPEWLQKKLDIHSPSRVFATLGGYLSEGLGVGIDEKSNSAINAVQRLSKRLPGALPAAMAIGLTATAANASPISAGPAVGTTGGQVVVHQYNTFHIQAQPGDDHQAIAKAIAAELDKRERQASSRSRSRLFDEE